MGALRVFVDIYGVLLIMITSGVAILFALCGCCGSKANRPTCAFCFCCCSAWHVCLTCAAMLQACLLLQYIQFSGPSLFQLLDACDPGQCNFAGANSTDNHIRQIDCLAQAQWGTNYVALNASNKRLSTHLCKDFPLLSCQVELDCFGSIFEWGQSYKMGMAGAACPCGSTHILDPTECSRAMRRFPRARVESIEPFFDDIEPSGCYAQKEGEWEFNFNQNMCNPKKPYKHVVCAIATRDVQTATRAKMERLCGHEGGSSPQERNPLRPPEQLEHPVTSCSAHAGFMDIMTLAKAEMPGVLRKATLMVGISSVFDGLGVVLFGLGCWWGQSLWSRMQPPLLEAHMQQGMQQAIQQLPSERRSQELQMVA
uniref:Uncharacterized protein n=1 Tax=Zooxanthella nutricula TaxID=1333877 RepID=A0A7S2PTI2_9DINO